MKIKGNSYFLIVIMVLMAVVVSLSLRMEYFTSKLLPLLVGIIVFILAAIGLVQDISAADKATATVIKDETSKKKEAGESLHDYLPIGIWVIGVSVFIYLLGFIITIPLFVLAYMKTHGVKWLVSIISTILITLLVYGGFEYALRVTLYRGLLFTFFH
mgnify:CR=1 FL=1